MSRLNPVKFLFVIQASDVISRPHILCTAAALVQALSASQKAQAQSDLACWNEVKLPLHHLILRQATIADFDSCHVSADNNFT